MLPPAGDLTRDVEEGAWYLAMALTDRAVAIGQTDSRSAQRDFERALQVLSRIPPSSPRVNDVKILRAVTLNRFGEHLQRQDGRSDDARARLEDALPILRGLIKDHSRIAFYREELAILMSGLARSDLAKGNLSEADRHCEESVTILDELRRSEPANPQYLSLRARALIISGNLANLRNRKQDSEARLAEAIVLLRRALELDPDRQIDRDVLQQLDPEQTSKAGHLESARARSSLAGLE